MKRFITTMLLVVAVLLLTASTTLAATMVKHTIRKGQTSVNVMNDLNGNTLPEAGEPMLHWSVSVTYPDGSVVEDTAPFAIRKAAPGEYPYTLDVVDGWYITSKYRDSVKVVGPISDPLINPFVRVTQVGTEGHSVLYLVARRGNVQACVHDVVGAPISGVTLSLTGSDYTGRDIVPINAVTDASGKANWPNLLPGSYIVVETVPVGMTPTTATSLSAAVLPGDSITLNFGLER